MFQFLSFGSGSSGNCYYLANENDALLIDAGISVRKVKHLMRDYGLSTGKLRAMLITHDHADHVKAAGVLSSDLSLPVYATQPVHEGIRHSYRFYRKIDDINVKGLETLPADRSGVDVVKVFNIVRKAIMEQKRWDVEELSIIGSFSFNKFLMWMSKMRSIISSVMGENGTISVRRARNSGRNCPCITSKS